MSLHLLAGTLSSRSGLLRHNVFETASEHFPGDGWGAPWMVVRTDPRAGLTRTEMDAVGAWHADPSRANLCLYGGVVVRPDDDG